MALLGVLLTGCGGSGGGGHLGVKGEVTPVGQRVAGPALAGQALGGGTYDLAAQRGKVVVLNTFGSWCTPCKAEARGLQQVAAATQGAGVGFVGLAVRDTPDNMAKFRDTYGVTYPLVLDPDGGLLARIHEVPGAPPNTLVLDRRGRVAARWIGGVLGSQLQAVVQTVAAEPA